MLPVHVVGITPLEVRELEKVDAVIFGHDKFAFEMVHFVKSTLGKNGRPTSGNKSAKKLSVEDSWESNFVQGLESLLVECAVVNDDIERDCFVSRVYCWFTEKLQERRDLPRKSEYTYSLPFSFEQAHPYSYTISYLCRCKNREFASLH